MRESKLKGKGVLTKRTHEFVKYSKALFIAWKIGYRNHFIEKRLSPYCNTSYPPAQYLNYSNILLIAS